jgi:hypothetical protein
VTEERRSQPNLGSVAKVGWWSLAVWSALVIGALVVGPTAAAGVALGGGMTLGFLALHLSLVRLWARPRRHWSARAYLWFLWLAKWPLVGTALWFCLKGGLVSPVWICAGAAIVPTVATLVAVRTLGVTPSEGGAHAGA